jgi:hypothetical protein
MNEEKLLPEKHTVELGGKTLELRFRVKAIMAAQKRLKGQDFFSDISTGNMEAFLTCLWAALLCNKPAPSFEQVEDWCEEVPLAELNEKIAGPLGKAISEGTVTDEAEDKETKKENP